MNNIKEISVKDFKGLNVGNSMDSTNQTGVTVLYFPNGATIGCDISGGGPASRETPLTLPTTADNPINAIVLSGGSAYGLSASDGVMNCLEEHGIGYNTGVCLVPLVCQSCIFDLGYKSSKIRPNSQLGYDACLNALNNTDDRMGNIGGGAGATVGKICGMKQAMKSGLGIHCVQIGEIQIAAIVIVNALGDIYDADTQKKIAGLTTPDKTEFMDTCEVLSQFIKPRDLFTGNTTIGAIVTNAKFSKAEMTKIASMTRNAYSRCIKPVGTMADGDTIYAASVGDIKADINAIGMIASNAMEQAIKNAIIYSNK